MICMKKLDFLVAREQKLGPRDHRALLEHSPEFLTHSPLNRP